MIVRTLQLFRRPLMAWTSGVAIALSGCSAGTDPTTELAAGQADLQRQDARSAVIRFKTAVQLDPANAEARYWLGVALLDSGDPVGSAVELKRALEMKHDATKTLPVLARAMVTSGQAKPLTELLVGRDVADPAAQASLQASLAAAWLSLDEPTKANEAIAASLKASPGFPMALVLKARTLAGANDVAQAQALVEEALKGDPQLPEAWTLKGELLSLAPDQATQAEAMLRKAIQARKDHLPAYLSLISLKMRVGDKEGARQVAADLRAALPNHPHSRFIEAQLAYMDGNFAAARETSQVLLRAAPDHPGFLQLAGVLEAQAGSLVQASSHFARALGVNPSYVLARLNLARSQLRLGQAGKTLETLKPLLADGSVVNVDALSLAGEASLQTGDPAQAEDYFKRAAAVQPDDERVRTSIALAQLAQGQADVALASLADLSARGQETDAGMALVSARLARREYAAALKEVQALQKLHPKDARVLELQGRVHTRLRDYPAARAAIEQALALDPSLFSATADLAAIATLQRKPDEAERLLRAAITADPRNHLAYMALAHLKERSGAELPEVQALLVEGIKVSPFEADPRLQLVDLLLRARKFDAALQVAQEAGTALPDDIKVQDALGRAQIQAGQIEQAISTFRRMTGMDEKSGTAHVRLADVLRANGDIPRSTASLKRALEIEPDLEVARARLVETLLSDGKADEAIQLARQSQATDPSSALGYLLESAIQRRLRKPAEAAQILRNGLERVDAKPFMALELYKTLHEAKRMTEAERFADDWLKRNPQHAAMHYERGVNAALAKDLPGAERHLAQAVEAAPKHPMALNNLAWVLAAQRKPGAVAYAQRAVELLPEQAALKDTLAMALAADGQLPQALDMQKSAVELAPKDYGIRLNLARLALQANDKTLARQELEGLAALGPAFGFQSEVSRLMKDL